MSSGSGGRRESNGRSRTRDPCLGKVALGEFMVMRIIIVMLVLVCDRDGIHISQGEVYAVKKKENIIGALWFRQGWSSSSSSLLSSSS